MTLWLVRAGRDGERESTAIDNNLAVIGWSDLPALTDVHTREDLRALMDATYPEESAKTLTNWTSQVWAFRGRMEIGDLVALPLKSQPIVKFGRITGGYTYRTDLGQITTHVRAVEWLKDIPRTQISQDLLYSLGAFMTVCRISRNDAEQRIRTMIDAPDEELAPHASLDMPAPLPVDPAVDDVESTETDLQEAGLDQIRKYIESKYKEHELARLVGVLLRAQGYHVHVSKPGADGGVDLLAGSGPLGFDSPRLAVQVKSSKAPESVYALRELQGVLKTFGADQGLLVCWSGFNKAVEAEARKSFFLVRLWSANEIVDAILENYDRLAPEFRAELPLRRVWVLAKTSE